MRIYKNHRSPHFEDLLIPVEFVVLHYTAQSLKESLKIFLSPQSKVSCHLLIDRGAAVYELVDCLEGKTKKAFHAGQSFWQDIENKNWKSFNNFSIGIELVNWNGNLFPYTREQYESLFQVLNDLKTKYPSLKNPARILGHEQVAGFRGKKDPGGLFDWENLFKNVYREELNLATKQWDESEADEPRFSQSRPKVSKKEILKVDEFKIEDKGTLSFEGFNQHNKARLKSQASPQVSNSENIRDKMTENTKQKDGINKNYPVRNSVLTQKQRDSLKFLKKTKFWNDSRAKKISLVLENNKYPFWLKKHFLFFYQLFF